LTLLLQTDFDVAGTQVSNITPVWSGAFFYVLDPAFGCEPWISDGTPEGTRLLKDINLGSASSGIHSDTFAYLDGWVYFGADDGVNGIELWRTDGTEMGTQLFADLIPGPEGYFGMNLRVADNHLYVSGFYGSGLSDLWVLE